MRETPEKNKSWFYKWFLNNQLTVILINIFLVFLIIFLFSKISFVFNQSDKFWELLCHRSSWPWYCII